MTKEKIEVGDRIISRGGYITTVEKITHYKSAFPQYWGYWYRNGLIEDTTYGWNSDVTLLIKRTQEEELWL